jgi:hypothetical protein
MTCNFSLVCTAQADHSQRSSAHGENQHMYETPDRAGRDIPLLSETVGGFHQGISQVQFRREAEWNSPFLEVPIALNRIELDLQDLIVYT